MNIDTPQGMAQAAAWTQAQISRLKPGGIWIIPRSGTQVQVFPATKTVVIDGPEKAMLTRVFTHMGYRVSKMT